MNLIGTDQVLPKRNHGLTFLMMLALASCQQEEAPVPTPFDGPLFKVVTLAHSGIDFVNNLPESDYMNGFLYEYFYNGGGVGVGDFNNDGLEDIYFTSNLEDNKLFINRGGLKFEDVTETAKVAGKAGWATGVSVVDLNQDGLLDIYVCRSGAFTDPDLRRNELFINQGADENGIPVFEESAAHFGLDDPSHGVQPSFFDFDLDGDLDLFLANHNPESPPLGLQKIIELHHQTSRYGGNKLLKNNDGSFMDVSNQAGIHATRMNYTLGISVSDVNNDGWPDMYVANDYSEPDYLYLNNGDGTFIEVSQQSLAHMPNASMGSDIADINNDGLLDIMSLDMAASDNFGIKTSMSGMNPERFQGHVEAGLHRQYMYNALQLNNGSLDESPPLFSDIAQMAGVSNTDWSWAPLLADFDNDGYKDLFITNGVKRDFINNDFNIYLNNEIERIKSQHQDPLNHFARLTQEAPTREKVNYVYRNQGDLTYQDVSTQWGLSHKSLSHGAAYADLDNDGDLDLVINNTDSPAEILENMSNGYRNYFSFSFVGPENNRNGIGVKVTVSSKGMTQVREQYPTRGFQSSVSYVLHFGMAQEQMADEVLVSWPDGKQQLLFNVRTNQHIILDYGNAKNKTGTLPIPGSRLFSDLTNDVEIDFVHVENEFNDFERESLLPHKMSQLGPALAVGDVNRDGLDDFYIGGAKGFPGSLFLQDKQAGFYRVNREFWEGDKNYEDVDARFFDADNDGDLDLLVVSGGNEYLEGSNFYRSRIYENTGDGSFKRSLSTGQLPIISGSVVRSADFDNDGDLDLFLGGRQNPGRYPFPVNSFLFRNTSENGVIRFENITEEMLPELNSVGMVTDAVWTDLNGDAFPELVLCGEWMGIKVYINQPNGFVQDRNSGLDQYRGWWYSIISADFDGDGDRDLVAGNHGLNNKYQTTVSEPFQIYTADFDNNGSYDIVLGYYNQGELFPVRGRECTSNQMPFVKQKFTTYEAFGKATLYDVYGLENLSKALHYQVNTFASTYFENNGSDGFKARPLGNLAQVSSVKTLLVNDYDHDGHLDLLLAGNMYEMEVETPRNDASYGLFMKGDGQGNFSSVRPNDSGLYVIGDVKKSAILELANGSKCILFARNGDSPVLVRIEQ